MSKAPNTDLIREGTEPDSESLDQRQREITETKTESPLIRNFDKNKFVRQPFFRIWSLFQEINCKTRSSKTCNLKILMLEDIEQLKNTKKIDPDTDKARVTAIVRMTDSSEPKTKMILELSKYVDEIIIPFSGTEHQYEEVRREFSRVEEIKVFRTISIGYPEPIIERIGKESRNKWILYLIDTEIPSIDFLRNLIYLTLSDFSVLNVMRIPKYKKEDVPAWRQKQYTSNYRPIFFDKEKTHWGDIIHEAPRTHGKILWLDPKAGLVYHTTDFSYTANVEKNRRYLLIEMFSRRKGRERYLEFFKKLYGKELNFNLKPRFLTSEYSLLEYGLESLLSSFLFRDRAIDEYNQIRIQILRRLKKYRDLTFEISRDVTSYGDLLEYAGIRNIYVKDLDSSLEGLFIPKGSDEVFVRLLIEAFSKRNSREIDVDDVMTEVIRAVNECVAAGIRRF